MIEVSGVSVRPSGKTIVEDVGFPPLPRASADGDRRAERLRQDDDDEGRIGRTAL